MAESSDKPSPFKKAFKPKESPLFSLNNPNKGIIRNMTTTVELNNEQIARAIKVQVESHLKRIPYTEVTDHGDLTSTIDVNLHAMVQKWIDKTDQDLVRITKADPQFKEVLVKYKKIAHDDGAKLELELNTNALIEFMANRQAGRQIEFTGILVPDSVPEGKEGIQQLIPELLGMNPESGSIVVDGQVLLKILQAAFNESAKKKMAEAEAEKKEMMGALKPENMQKAAAKIKKYLPSFSIELEGDSLKIHIDSKDITHLLKSKGEEYLPKVPGIRLVKPADGYDDPDRLQFSVNYKDLTENTLGMVSKFASKVPNGMSMRVDRDVTTIQTDTNKMRADLVIRAATARLNAALTGDKPDPNLKSVDDIRKDDPTRGQEPGK